MPHSSVASGDSCAPRLSVLNVADEENWMYDATYSGHPVRLVVESYASHHFMSYESAKRKKWDIEHVSDKTIELGDNTKKKLKGVVTDVLNLEGHLSKESVYLIDMGGEESPPVIILGRAWLKERNPKINCSYNTLVLSKPNGSMVRVVPRTQIGETTTNSIPKVSFKKLARVLKKGNRELYMARIMRNNFV